jgi:anaerobic selenocysteine-containing dehydrogenase
MAGCGVNCYIHNGRLVDIAGMPEAPTNQGRLCPKAFASTQWLYSPQRLKTPLKRTGKRGEGKFAPISWDEALTLIAGELGEQKEKYGPESLAILSPARRSYNDYLQRFLAVHGSPNYGHSGLCAIQQAFGFAYIVGFPMLGMRGADLDQSELILIWGANPVFSGGPQGRLQKIFKARERGARVVSIKPELQPDAARADVWIPIRPGTDGALALAMLQVVIEDNIYDHDFVSRWCYGFDQLADHVRQYTPQWAEEITGISAQKIRDLARMYATSGSACIITGNAFDQTVNSSNAVRAVAALIAISGNLDRPGGNVVPVGSDMPKLNPVTPWELFTPELINKLVAPEVAMPFQPFIEGPSSAYYSCLESVLTQDPYPIHSIIAPGTQPTVSTRNPGRVIEALRRVDFLAVIDVMETAAMPWADVVVPVASMYECDHPFEVAGNWIMARNKVVEPLGEYGSDYQFWLDLGVKMGYGEYFWEGSIERCMDYQLENFGFSMEELRAYPTGIVYEPKPMVYEKYEQIFSTPSTRLSKAPYLPQGKVALYNTTFAAHGFAPMPEWREPPEGQTGTPDLAEKYPLIFTDTHTSDAYCHGWLRNIPYLREMQPYPWLHLHPDTAKARGIEDGDWVIVESPHGRISLQAQYTPGIRPDTVMSLHGWWQGCEELGLEGFSLVEGGANVNLMYSTDPADAFDPLVTAMPKQTLVQIRKAEGR